MIKLTIEDCIGYASDNGGQCLSLIYKDANTKIKWRCNKGHEWEASFGWMKSSKSWCPFCSGARICCEDLKQEFIDEGYTPLFESYKSQRDKLDFVCPNGHKYFITQMSWRSGGRCAVCAGSRVDIVEVQKKISERGFIMISNYSRSAVKMDLVCPNGHECKIDWDHFKQGRGCKKCVKQTSKAENKLYEMIMNKYDYLEVLKNNRTIIQPYEIDIAIPRYKIAIEYNGAGHYKSIYGGTKQQREKNLEKTKKKDDIKKDMLFGLGWRFMWLKDTGPFNINTVDKAFRWLVVRIDRIIKHEESLCAISLDDVGYY